MKRKASRTATELARQDRMRGVRATYDPLRPDVFSMVVDTREQTIGPIPLDVPVLVEKLPFGDLSVVGHAQSIAIDRKQLGDFIGCITWQKDRFTRLLAHLAQLEFAAIAVEATIADVRARKYRADVPPAFVLGAAAKITTKYRVPVFFCGSLESSTDYCVRLLRAWWRERGLRTDLKASGE